MMLPTLGSRTAKEQNNSSRSCSDILLVNAEHAVIEFQSVQRQDELCALTWKCGVDVQAVATRRWAVCWKSCSRHPTSAWLLFLTARLWRCVEHWRSVSLLFIHSFILSFTHSFICIRQLRSIDWAHTHTPVQWSFVRDYPGELEPIWILLKQETLSGSGISWAICKSAPRSRQITMPTPQHSVFYRPDALPDAQPTALKHWSTNSSGNTCVRVNSN